MWAATTLAIVSLIGHAGLSGAQLSPTRDPARLRAGLFLYAAPGIGDRRFAETVILLIKHGAEGTVGLVVNQPTEVSLRKTLPSVPEARRSETPTYWGGPVQPEVTLALLRSPRAGQASEMVIPDVHFTTDLETLRTALSDPRPDRAVRVYSGYAGWSRGQLAKEVRLGAWVLDRADADAVFTLDPTILWDKVHAIMNRREARKAPVSDDLAHAVLSGAAGGS
jgi:putative transcriptional regulator